MAPSNLEGKASAGSQGNHSGGVAAPVQAPSSPTEDKVFTLGAAPTLASCGYQHTIAMPEVQV